MDPVHVTVSPPLPYRHLAVHQHGQEPVAEMGELLVFLLQHILAFENGIDRVCESFHNFSSPVLYIPPECA